MHSGLEERLGKQCGKKLEGGGENADGGEDLKHADPHILTNDTDDSSQSPHPDPAEAAELVHRSAVEPVSSYPNIEAFEPLAELGPGLEIILDPDIDLFALAIDESIPTVDPVTLL